MVECFCASAAPQVSALISSKLHLVICLRTADSPSPMETLDACAAMYLPLLSAADDLAAPAAVAQASACGSNVPTLQSALAGLPALRRCRLRVLLPWA
eukprot:2522560-Pleurochrysis_carterae.AAC.1